MFRSCRRSGGKRRDCRRKIQAQRRKDKGGTWLQRTGRTVGRVLTSVGPSVLAAAGLGGVSDVIGLFGKNGRKKNRKGTVGNTNRRRQTRRNRFTRSSLSGNKKYMERMARINARKEKRRKAAIDRLNARNRRRLKNATVSYGNRPFAVRNTENSSRWHKLYGTGKAVRRPVGTVNTIKPKTYTRFGMPILPSASSLAKKNKKKFNLFSFIKNVTDFVPGVVGTVKQVKEATKSVKEAVQEAKEVLKPNASKSSNTLSKKEEVDTKSYEDKKNKSWWLFALAALLFLFSFLILRKKS